MDKHSTFYLKYRPQKIEDLDIESVRNSLTKIVESGNIPHALLFSGVRGTGKTSTARIISKIINCEEKNRPCNNCEQCKTITEGTNIDVIEMDAASNRGIEDIRSLKDTVKLSPSKSKAKIYIIDEAHMLTLEASNALLKTLEEPPSHVYFILATTNPEKLIDTIKSRVTEIVFTKATKEESKRSLNKIIKAENISIADQNLDKIVKKAKGSFRDAVKLLEQYSKDNTFLDNNNVNIDDLVEIIVEKNKNKAFEQIKIAINSGVTNDFLIGEMLEKLQQKLINGDKNIVLLIEEILKHQELTKYSPIDELPLLLAITKWCDS
jgi:DNA polymerase-3 subunit gamma/tau